jgi:alkylation response protein AidB-like acyl-CoA dehydrogenase
MTYTPPIAAIAHTLRSVARLDALPGEGGVQRFDAELVDTILAEAGKLAREALFPVSASGHAQGASLGPDGVRAPPGFREAYQAFRDGGWMGLAFPEAYGGQGLPRPLALAVMEMIHGSNMAFGLCPLLTFGAIEALLAHGDDEQKAVYLPRLVSGEWTGAMNLTEPQAGSDVGALRTKAIPLGDGRYAISGQKIYITWGDHDLTDNIIQLVLARLPDAPAGSRGISLFLVPKRFVLSDGSLGERNAYRCIGLERKIGLHGSPTCVMEYDSAIGWMIGEPHRGLAAMFTMMNSARLNVGLEGVAVADASLQTAIAYAHDRKQGAAPGIEGPAPIIRHPDIRRTLAETAAAVQAARGLCYACGAAADRALFSPDREDRERARRREDLLTPIAKAWSTETGVEAASAAVQVHGGLGFMEATAAARFYADSRIMPIYEGANGIQAIDLAGRKLAADDGLAIAEMIADMRATSAAARRMNSEAFAAIADGVEKAAAALEEAASWMRRAMSEDRATGLAAATPFLFIASEAIGGAILAGGAVSEAAGGGSYAGEAEALACLFAETRMAILPARARGLPRAAGAVETAARHLERHG